MAEHVYTDEEMEALEEGEAARSLLTSPMFLTAIERVRKDCAEAILTSAPTDAEKRENLYNLSRGLSAVTAELDALVSYAEAIVAQADTQAPAVHLEEDDEPALPF